MNKIYSVLAGGLLSALALGTIPALAQTQPVPVRRCVTEEVNAVRQAELQRLIPGYNPARSTNQRPIKALRTGAVTYTLPVIVHVVHNGEAVGTGYNISRAQVQSQLDVLNEDYRNLNADGSLVPGVYQPRRGDMQIQFVPALRDPNGNTLAEPGIDRVNRNTKGWTAAPYGTADGNTDYIDNTIKPGSYWDPTKYINIWVMSINGGILGYAQFPDNTAGLGGLTVLGGLAATDGVVVHYTSFGSRLKNPTGNYGSAANVYDKGRTLTHELGHWLGLRHIWGDNNCGDDYCADTPTQQTANFNCPTFPHVTCSNVTGDMSMNYMDYVDDACMYMFSASQKERIQAVMESTPRRAELVNSTVACPSVVAATVANSGAACPGGTVTLSATGPAGATYAWSGPNGYTSTQQNPVLTNIALTMAGTYTVTVTGGSGLCPFISGTRVVVNPAPAVPVLASSAPTVCPGATARLSATIAAPTATTLVDENFNGTATGWTLSNSGAAITGWQLSNAPYTYRSRYLVLTNYSVDGTRFALANSDAGGSTGLTNTALISPAFNTNGYASLQLTFQHYFRYGDSYLAQVEVSTDGTTWTPVTSYKSTQGTATAPATATINLNAYISKPSVQVRWRYNADWDYCWAIDNVKVTGTIATPTYAWSVVSGDGLPTVVNTSTLSVTPTQASVYRLTVSYPGYSCTSSATIAVGIATPVWTGTAGNANWFDAGNWQGGCVPTRTTDATIPAGLTTPYPIIATGTAEVKTLTQQGSLTMTGGELDLYGNHAGTGTLTLSGGIVATRGTVAQALRGATYQTLLIAGTGTKTIPASTVGRALTMSGAILNTGTAIVTLAPAATISETDATYVLGQVRTTHVVGTSTDTFGGLGFSLTPSTAAGSTTVTRVTGTPQGTSPGVSISRYFDVTATVSRGLQGANLALSYFPHELNGLSESQLALYKSISTGATWSNEGATSRDATAKVVSRNYVTYLEGRWTLASATAPLPVANVNYFISAFPVPFSADGLGIQVTTDTAGPLYVKLYDTVGRVIYDHVVNTVEVGTSNVVLPGSGQLVNGQYILNVTQNGKETRLKVVRQ